MATRLLGPIENDVLSVKVMPRLPSGPVSKTSCSLRTSPIFTGSFLEPRTTVTWPFTIFALPIDGASAAARADHATTIATHAAATHCRIVTSLDRWISGSRHFITWPASVANAKMASVKLSSSVARAAGLALLVALAGCSTPAEVSCLAGESLCHGACIPEGTACPGAAVDMAGGLCDGGGSCVAGCSLPTDCPATTSACVANLCNPTAHVCMLVDAPAGIPCSDSGGTACDGMGACVGPGPSGAPCSSSMQCESGQCGTTGGGSHCCAQSCPSGPCGAADCDTTGACVLMPKNAPCGAGLCNGAGTCVLPCGQSMYKCAFVTSQSYDGNLGGTAGADATCASAATAAGLTGTFAAWLSVTGFDANSRIGASTQ